MMFVFESRQVDDPDFAMLSAKKHSIDQQASRIRKCITVGFMRFFHAFRVLEFCHGRFDSLPLAATIDDKIFSVHAGLSPEMAEVQVPRSMHAEVDGLSRENLPSVNMFC